MKLGRRSQSAPRKQSNLMKTYISSMLSLVLCCAMLLGTTMAWFTSTVESTGHEIYVGVLKVDLLNEEGSLADKDKNIKLFDNNPDPAGENKMRWEPGATAYEFLTVRNRGDLAFNYDLSLTCNTVKEKDANGDMVEEVSVTESEKLAIASAFDVYVSVGKQDVTAADDFKDLIAPKFDPENPDPENPDPEKPADKHMAEWERIGTLEEILTPGGKKVFQGTMTENDTDDDIYTVAIHMREEVEGTVRGVNIMGKSLVLNAKLVAVQKTFESDSFGPEYDMDQDTPRAIVTELANKNINYVTFENKNEATDEELDAAYSFRPTDSLEDSQKSAYRYWHADYVISADKKVPANSVLLAGYYDAWCNLLSNDNWIGFTNEGIDVDAGEEIRLVGGMGDGFTVNYEAICGYGNDGVGFLCGVADISDTDALAGTTITVELRLYETTIEPEAGSGSANVETGKWITVGKTTYTFPKAPTVVSDSAGLIAALANAADGDTIVLGNDIVATMPDASGYTNGEVFYVDKSITLDGRGHKITVDPTNWDKVNGEKTGNIIGVGVGDAYLDGTDTVNATIKNLTIVGDSSVMKNGISVYQANNNDGVSTAVTLENVNVSNCGAASIMVNRATATLKGSNDIEVGSWQYAIGVFNGGVLVDEANTMTEVETGYFVPASAVQQ